MKISILSFINQHVILNKFVLQCYNNKHCVVAVLVSSSCSTDETIVADSDTEVETATSARSTEALSNDNNVKYEKTEEIYDDSYTLDKRKHESIEASSDDVLTRLHDIKRTKREKSLDGASVRSHATNFGNDNDGVKVKKDNVDDNETGNSDVVYSQNLIVRDTNIRSSISTSPSSSFPNFKCFRKVCSCGAASRLKMCLL